MLQRFPHSRLAPCARENLALIFERLGRLVDALRQYVKLGYDMDAAYMLDVKLSPAQVAEFAGSSPAGKARELAVYSLGVRYMRTNRFAAALREFHRIPERKRREMAGLVTHRGDEWWDTDHRKWLHDPAWTAAKLSRLHLAVRNAKGKEKKARAIYALAAFLLRQGNLVLYNKPAWRFMRADSYGFFWNPYVATAADAKAWRRHCFEHESFARARALCLEIVRRYPRTSVGARATYSAAICCDHLSGFNPWWRDEDARVHLKSQAARLMKLVVRRYPKSGFRKAAAKYAGVFAVEATERERPYWVYRLKWDRERRSESE